MSEKISNKVAIVTGADVQTGNFCRCSSAVLFLISPQAKHITGQSIKNSKQNASVYLRNLLDERISPKRK